MLLVGLIIIYFWGISTFCPYKISLIKLMKFICFIGYFIIFQKWTIKHVNFINFISGIFKDKMSQYSQSIYYFSIVTSYALAYADDTIFFLKNEKSALGI